MARQLLIKVPESKPKSHSLHDVVVGILVKYGPRKQAVLAAQLGASESHLSEVMRGAGKHWPAEWLEYIAEHYDFECDLASHFAARRGMVVTPPRKPSAAEQLRRLRFVLSNHNSLGKAISDEAEALPDEVFAEEGAEGQ